MSTDDANHKRRTTIAERVRWPLDKLGEVEQESEFDGVFRAFRILGKRFRSTQEDPPAMMAQK